MTISGKINLSFLVSAFVLTAACVAIVYHIDRGRIEKNLLSHLSTTAQSQDGSWSGKILIVDDEEIVTRTLLDCLGDLHDIEIAESGREALESSKTGDLDVALIDLDPHEKRTAGLAVASDSPILGR